MEDDAGWPAAAVPQLGQRATLTEREMQVLEVLASGASGKELAISVGRSRATVEAEIRVLFIKLGARSRHHLVAQAFRLGVLAPSVRAKSDGAARRSY